MLPRVRTSNFKFFALLLVFIIPVVVSWVMYEYPDYFNFHTTNHGKLLQPMPHDVNLLNGDHPNWQIVYAPADCQSEQSSQTMFMLHQLRRAMGKDAQRIGLVLLTETPCPLQDSHDFRKVLINTATLRAVLEDHRIENKIFLVDPQANIFMYYSENGDAMRIMKDLKRVLEVSQIG